MTLDIQGLQKRLELLKESLKGKWNKDSSNLLFDDCSFCEHANQERDRIYDDGGEDYYPCHVCLCPSDICESGGQFGFMDEISKQPNVSDDDKISKIAEEAPLHYKHMVLLFKYWIEKTENEILDFLNAKFMEML
jgi:hypothetical protein